jgi:hypothetical protein
MIQIWLDMNCSLLSIHLKTDSADWLDLDLLELCLDAITTRPKGHYEQS